MKYWVFDLDGTLVDSFRYYFQALSTELGELGIQLNDHDYQRSLRMGTREFLQGYVAPNSTEQLAEKIFARSNRDSAAIQIFSGLERTIQKLHSTSDGLAVWTARDLTSASLVLQHTGLQQYFPILVSGNCVTNHKPHPEGLTKIMQNFGCAPEDIVMVGDHEFDVQAAKSVGARAVRASWHSYWDIDNCSQSDHQFFHVDHFHDWVHQSLR